MNNYNSWLDSHKWESNEPPPMSRKKMEWFQRELDGIVGVEPNGAKRMKLVWLPHYDVFDAYRGERRLLFNWGKRPDVGVPRYALLSFTGQYTPLHLQQAGKELDLIETMERPDGIIEYQKHYTPYHAAPEEPQYRVDLIFAAHVKRKNPTDLYAPCCLARIMSFDRGWDKCYGKYVEPDEEDLNAIRWEMNEVEKRFGHMPNPRYHWIMQNQKEADERAEAERQANEEYLDKHNAKALYKAMDAAINSSRSTSLPAIKP